MDEKQDKQFNTENKIWQRQLFRSSSVGTLSNVCPGNTILYIYISKETPWKRVNVLIMGIKSKFVISVLSSFYVCIEPYFLKWWLQIEKFTKDPREFFGLFVTDKTDSNEKRAFHCADSIDSYEHSDISVFFNSKEKTCNMMGLQYLEKGDILRLKVITSNTAVTISQDKTFFGAVLFSWLDLFWTPGLKKQIRKG